MTKEDINDLKFLRVIDPDHIPTYLVEQLKERDFEIEDFYAWQKANATVIHDGLFLPNPNNHLWVMINDKRQVKGFVWAIIDTLTRDLVVNHYSVDKNYWHSGEAIAKLKKHLIQVLKDNNLDKIIWFTKNAKAYQKYGFKPTKVTMLEYNLEEDNG